jgi:tape measure domain-containing protein
MAAPELRLSVGLDLALLRQQISTIGTQLGGQPITLRTQFDRRLIATQYKALDRFLNSKTFTLKIKDVQLDASIAKAEKLKDRLEALQDTKLEIPVSGRAAVSQREARKIRTDVYRGIMAQGGKILLPVGLQPLSDSAASKFKADVVRKLGSTTIDVKANLQSAAIRGGAKTQAEIDAEVARGMQTISAMGAARMAGGGVTEAARRSQLQSRLETGGFTNEQLRQIAKQMNVSGVSKLNKGNIIQKIVADASVEMIKKFLDPQAVMRNPDRSGVQRVLDTFARGVFHMLGMDPAQVAAQRRARLAPPAINWPAQVPPSSRPPIGPSSTGRALPPGANFAALPGTSFAEQKRLVGDILSPSLKEALRGAANAFVDSIKAELNAAVRSVNVRDLGTSMQAALGGRQIAGLLPSATGMSVQDRIAQAYQRSAARGLSVMAEGVGGGGPPQLPPGVGRTPAPYGGGGERPSTALPSGYLAGGRFAKSLGEADRYLRQARVPLAGAIEELAGEFGQATKQVLLYGAAYKGLAFIMDLPRQALDASSALQSIRNQLNAITGSAAETDRSFAFLDNLADRFAVPLASIREGFARMYASMAPAGFGAEEIQNLFTGVSKAAATFGLSADKVDRVTYALSQMASKGQITAEELRGQLGDVLPGALALFAEAAQMDIPEFSKAMEDGAFRGKAMQQVLNNVGILLNRDFSQGAAGAAKTLRGALNDMQNSVLRLYEAFEPLVNIVAQQAFPLISEAVASATQAVQAFAAAAQGNAGPAGALSGQALAIYTVFQQITEIGRALGDVIMSLAPTFAELGRFILFALEQIARFINTPVGGFLANFAAKVALVTAALQLMAKAGIVAAVRGLVLLATQTQATIVKLRVLIATSAAAKAALAGIVVAAVWTAFEILANSIDRVNQKLAESAARARKARDELNEMAVAGMTEPITRKLGEAEERVQSFKRSRDILATIAAKGPQQVSEEDFARLQRSGLAAGLARGPGGFVQRAAGGVPLVGASPDITQQQASANLQLAEIAWREALSDAGNAADELKTAVQVANQSKQQALTPIDLQPSGDPDKAARKAEEDRAKLAAEQQRLAEQYARQQGQLITATAEFQNDKDKLRYEQMRELAEQSFELEKSLMDAKFDYEMAGMNEIHAKNKRNEKELLEIQMRSTRRLSEATARVTEAGMKINAAKALRAASQRAAALLPAEGAAAMGGQGNVQNYLRRLAFLETRIRNVPNAEGSGAMGYFQTKGPFHQEALAASGGKNSRSANYSESAAAVEGWIKRHRPRAYEAIVAGRFDDADAILSQGTWPSLPGGSQAQPPEIQRQARQFLTPPAAPVLPSVTGAAPPASVATLGVAVPVIHPETGSGYTVPGVKDAQGRPVVFSREAAEAFAAMITASGGQVRGSDIASSQRSARKNAAVGGATGSRHLAGTAMDIHGRSLEWIKRHGAQYGWNIHDYPGSHGGHVEFSGMKRPASGARQSIARAEQGAEFSVELAEMERANVLAIELGKVVNGARVDLEQTRALLAQQVGEIFPVEQLRLDAQLLKERNALLLQGAPEEYIQAREQITRADIAGTLQAETYRQKITELEVQEKTLAEQVKKGGEMQALYEAELKGVQDRIALHTKALESVTTQQAAYNAEVLEASLLALKNADAMKAMEEAAALVNDAVDGVLSSYKGLFVDIMSGGDIKEAAKRMQESLSKQVFTMFIDFSMKPVEKFFKDQLLNVFGLPNEEEQRAETIAAMERQIAALDRNTAALQGTPAGASGQAFGGNASLPSPLMGDVLNAPAFEMSGKAMQEASEQAWQFPDSLGGMGQAMEQFNANTSAVTSSLVEEARKGATATTTWQQNLGKTVSAVGIAASSIVGITAGISQIKEGGVSGVLGGIGSIAMSLGSALGGFSALGGLGGLFGGGGGAAAMSGGSGIPWNFNTGLKFFANGGVVNGPTLGMVGEGRYNEAIVPLPDGRSIPVKMNDQSASLREAMNTMSPIQAMAPILSMKFESTNIGGVEYVSRDQLEAAMASTRRQAAKDGALRGMNMTLDKIQQSPATRSRIGMRGR